MIVIYNSKTLMAQANRCWRTGFILQAFSETLANVDTVPIHVHIPNLLPVCQSASLSAKGNPHKSEHEDRQRENQSYNRSQTIVEAFTNQTNIVFTISRW